MIHQLIFASPKPGLSEQEFQDYWVKVHAVKYASKIPQIVRYLINTRIALPGESKPPLWSGVAEIWLQNEKEQLASLRSKEYLQGARLDEPNWAAFWNTLGLDTETKVLVKVAPEKKAPAWIKLITLMKRQEGLKLKEFRRYSLGAHADLVQNLPGLSGYSQCHTCDALYAVGEPRFDCCSLLWFDSPAALQKAQASSQFKKVKKDLIKFVEQKYIFSLAAEEHWIIGPKARS